MHPVHPPSTSDKMTLRLSRELEDHLDFQENQERSAVEIRRVDAAFVGGFSLMTLTWMLVWTGAIGGVAAVAIRLFIAD
jgi:hypothetical protein